jgi:hypothetical protein
VYDLAADPGERSPKKAGPELEPLLARLVVVMNEHRLVEHPPPPSADITYGRWRCKPERICVHPVKKPE